MVASYFLAAARIAWLSVRHPGTSYTLVIKDGKTHVRGERLLSCGVAELSGGIACERCHGSGGEPAGDALFLCRILPPSSAQALHELLRDEHPDHDEVECHCCCLDCPGWTENMGKMSDEEIADLIPCHDRGKPYPGRLSAVLRDMSSGVQT